MSLNNPLASALSAILNHERLGRKECSTRPSSKLIKTVLRIMNENGYIGSFSEVEDGRGNFLVVNLLGRINKCGVVSPRFSFSIEELPKFEKRFLPARDFGILIVSTSKGLMTHQEAKKNNIGGKLVSYCY